MPVDFSIPASGFRTDLFYWLATLNLIAYREIDELAQEALAAAGECDFEFVETGFVDIPRAIVARYDRWLVIVVHGTANGHQWVNNVVGAAPLPSEGLPGLVHFYFSQASHLIKTAVLASRPWRQLPSNSPIMITGHSLGGACAQILAHLLDGRHGCPISNVMTLGAPKAGSRAFATHHYWPIMRLNNIGDPVPWVPPGLSFKWQTPIRTGVWDIAAAYTPAGDHIYLHADGRPSRINPPLTDEVGFNSWADFWKRIRSGEIISHYVPEYILRIRRLLPFNLHNTIWTEKIDLKAIDSINDRAFATLRALPGTFWGTRDYPEPWPFPREYGVNGPVPPAPPADANPARGFGVGTRQIDFRSFAQLGHTPSPVVHRRCTGDVRHACCHDR